MFNVNLTVKKKVVDWEEINQNVDSECFQVIAYVYLIFSLLFEKNMYYFYIQRRKLNKGQTHQFSSHCPRKEKARALELRGERS